jgi:membrane peptidoglycan carboxypeptidase
VEAGAGFGGDSAAPVFHAFMSQALADQPDIPLPDPGPVCARGGAQVNPTGGHQTAPVVPVVPVTPQLPTTPAPAPTAPTTPAPTTPTAPPVNPSPGGQGPNR